MEITEQRDNTSIYLQLWRAFTSGPVKFLSKVKTYVLTSVEIFSCSIFKLKNPLISDVKYAFLTFEFLLIFLFVSKLLTITVISDESEIVRDFLILLFYFIELLLIALVATIAGKFIYGSELKRAVQSAFIYLFSFLYFPSYIAVYLLFDLVKADEAAVDGLMNLTFVGWCIFTFIYYFRMNRYYEQGAVKSVLISLGLSLITSILLLLSIAPAYSLGDI